MTYRGTARVVQGCSILVQAFHSQITPADVQERNALPPLLDAVHQKSPWVKLTRVDGGYSGDETQRAAFQAAGSG